MKLKKGLTVPRLSGRPLTLAAALSRTPPGAKAIGALARAQLGVDELATVPESWRGKLPFDARAIAARPPRSGHDAALGPLPARAWPHRADDFAAAYRERKTTPSAVLERVLGACASLHAQRRNLDPLHHAAKEARVEANASSERHARGAARGPLDGVPVFVKEQVAIAGLPARMGTAGLPDVPAAESATVVEKLRAAGAVIVGHSAMTELGMSPIGLNKYRKMPGNAHDELRAPGGSSTGSAVATALGLSPVSVAADGGGSIRIPAALNGVFGLKPTAGRISRFGDSYHGNLNHIGPIGASTADLAALLEVAAGVDPRDYRTHAAPPPVAGSYARALGRGVHGLRLGVCEQEIAEAEPAIARACDEAMRALEREGATLVPVPFEMGAIAFPAGIVLLSCEGLADGSPHVRAGIELGPEFVMIEAIVASFTAVDVVEATLVREGLRQAMVRALLSVDALLTPTTRVAAPKITDAEYRSGVLDGALSRDLTRYTILANLTGHPAVTVPVGSDPDGLPLGVQLTGDAFDEATVLAIAAHLERLGVAHARRPRAAVELLG